MSAQSIIDITNDVACDKMDEFFVQEGNHFRNVVDYDLCSKVEYNKIAKVLRLKEIMLRQKFCKPNEVALIINKILR